MLPYIFLTDKGQTAHLENPKEFHYTWDGKGTMMLFLNRGKRKIPLHFSPWDGIKVTEENGILKLSRLLPPENLQRAVLWFIGVEKSLRKDSREEYEHAVQAICGCKRLTIADSMYLERMCWDEGDRVPPKFASGKYLYLIQDGPLYLARRSAIDGAYWADLAGYCDAGMSKEEAEQLFLKYCRGRFPPWYVARAVAQCSGDALSI